MEQTLKNKQTVIQLFDLMFNQNRVKEAIDKYISDEFIEHSPYLADGKEALIEYFERMAEEYPDKRVTIKRAIAEGDYVVLHCHQEWPGSKERHLAAIDIFRMNEEGRVAEHWDVIQAIPDEKVNSNPLF